MQVCLWGGAVLAADIASLTLAAPSGAAELQPPPIAANGAAVQVLATGLLTPTAFASELVDTRAAEIRAELAAGSDD